MCYLARWDRRKRPDLFFDLVARFPQVRFVAVGQSRDPAYDRGCARPTPISRTSSSRASWTSSGSQRLSRILGRSWIVVNTAAREGLPNAFLEAAAHRCAILESRWTPTASLRGSARGSGRGRLRRRPEPGCSSATAGANGASRGYAHVRDTFELHRAVNRHLEVYGANSVGERTEENVALSGLG